MWIQRQNIPLLIDAAEAKATRHNKSNIDCLIVNYPTLASKDQLICDTRSAGFPLYKGYVCMYLSDKDMQWSNKYNDFLSQNRIALY